MRQRALIFKGFIFSNEIIEKRLSDAEFVKMLQRLWLPTDYRSTNMLANSSYIPYNNKRKLNTFEVSEISIMPKALMKRETGANPVRTRHCDREFYTIGH